MEVAPYKMGRKTKYRANMCNTNFDMLSNGDSINSVCAKLGIHKDTYYEWVKTRPNFSDSHKRGMAAGEAYWDTATKQHMLGIVRLTIDAAYIMKMRNVYGQMSKDPDNSAEKTKEFMQDLAAIRSGGRVNEDEWKEAYSKKTSG